jgi:SAM-dependent methyltransferase
LRLLDRILEHPRAYSLVQQLTQLVGTGQLRAQFDEFINDRDHEDVLELGCGTGRWSTTRFRRFIRTDLNSRYFPASPPSGVEFRVVDATDLSCFPDDSFDLVYSVGLYHHLPDAAVVSSLRESARVSRPDGRVVVFDAILPTRRRNVLGRCLRALDRGRFVRVEAATRALVATAGLEIRRARSCRWGPALEGCWLELQGARGESARPPEAG